jgi:transaldolase
VKKITELGVKIFADGADKAGMLEMHARPYIREFTTNPTLMRRRGFRTIRPLRKDILKLIRDRPISFEVFCDDFEEMERQALQIAAWGANVYVKIPVTNTLAIPATGLIRSLASRRVRVNVTALMTLEQIKEVSQAIGASAPACISVFAGRVADTGRDPVPLMAEAVQALRRFPNQELIWASPRELLNIFQAD